MYNLSRIMQQNYTYIKSTYCKADMQVNLLTSIPQVLRNGLALILIISLCAYSNAQYQPSSCFATYQAVLWGNTSSTSILPTTPPSAGYPFSLAWRNVYPNIVSSSYALSGFKIAELNKPLGFTATLVTTATGGTFTYIPDAVSSIVYAVFSIVLVSNCNSGTFYMQRFTYTTTILFQATRTISQEFFYIASPFSFSNTSDYEIGVFLSSLRYISFLANDQQQFNLEFISLTPYKLYLRLYSSNGRRNTLAQVTATYFVAQISTFKSKLIFVSHYMDTASFTTNFGIPSIYDSYFTQKCIIGLNYFIFNYGNIRPSQSYFANSGTQAYPNLFSLILVNVPQVNYFVFALMECDIYSIVDVPTAPTLCRPCSDVMQHCLSCTSPTQCIECSVGWPVTGGCTQVSRCIIVNSSIGATTCTVCALGFILIDNRCSCLPGYWAVAGGCTNISLCITVTVNISNNISTCTACSPGSILNNSVCYCQSGYWLITQYCTNIIGCITTKLINNQVVCTFFNVMNRYQLVEAGCSCVSGFYISSISQCLEICGDGRVFQDQCDDGNTDSGDGCSSTCQNESKFICVNGSRTHKSECVYVGRGFKLTLKWIDKTHMQNQGIFAFTVYPPFSSLDRLNLTANLQFNCDGRGQFVSWKYSADLLLLKVDYQQNLQGYPANITLIFNPTFIIQKIFQTRFDMVSNGDKLIIVNNYGKCALLINLMTVLSFVVLFLFFVGSLTHKMIGVEILHSFQTIFLFQALSTNFTPVFGLLRYFSLVTGNFLFLNNAQTHIYRYKQDIYYNPKNQQFSESIIVGVSVFLSLCILPFLCAWAQSVDDPQSNRKRLSTTILRVIYSCLLFPFIIGFIMINLLNIVIYSQQGFMFADLPVSLSSTMSLILILISSFIFFFEFKLLFIKKGYWTVLQGLPKCKSAYIPMYLIYVFLLDLVMVFEYHQNSAYSLELIAAIVFVFFFYMVFRRPYQSHLHNAGQIMNVLMVLYFLGWMITRENFIQVTSQENEIFCMFLFCLLMTACIVISIIRTIVELRTKLKAEESNSLQLPKRESTNVKDQLEQLSQQNKKMQDLLRSFNPFYGPIVKERKKLEQVNRMNEQRLMIGVDCLYTQKSIEDSIKKLPTKYRRPDKKQKEQFYDHKSFLKKSLQDKIVRQEDNL